MKDFILVYIEEIFNQIDGSDLSVYANEIIALIIE
jgi:hypothetical protein